MQSPTRNNYYLVIAFVVLPVFSTIAVLIAIFQLYTTVDIGTPLTVFLLIAALLSGYGWYRIVTRFIGSKQSVSDHSTDGH